MLTSFYFVLQWWQEPKNIWVAEEAILVTDIVEEFWKQWKSGRKRLGKKTVNARQPWICVFSVSLALKHIR
jgi:hypothetical protein